jgi:hypothetical protein
MLRHPSEMRPASSGSIVTLPTDAGPERWVCWPDAQLEMFVIIERPDGSMVTTVRPGMRLTIREGARWRK